MLIDKNYKRNKITKDIIEREIVSVKCDSCDSIKETYYYNYKKKKLEKDFCMSCRNKLGIAGVKGGHSEKTRKAWKEKGKIHKINNFKNKCKNCKNNYTKQYKTKFCSVECTNKYNYKISYSYLVKNHIKFENEMAYLIGCILGDGSVQKNKNTSRVIVSCDTKHKEQINQLKYILVKMKIKHSVLCSKSKTTTYVNFNFPNEILKYYKLEISGCKYRCQPIVEKLNKNIHFAIGLINSDGYYAFKNKNKKKLKEIRICNTVESIIKQLKFCLEINNIKYNEYKFKNKNKNWKLRYEVRIPRQDEIKKIESISSIKLKFTH